MNGEHRPILPRDAAEPSHDPVIVGTDSILANAMQAAAQCVPPQVQQQAGNSCAVGACGSGQRVTRQSQNTTANSATIDLTYTFQAPFKLAMLTIPSAQADAATLTSVKCAGIELLRNGSINGGPFSSGNQESGGQIDGPWVYPGQSIKIQGTFSAAPATAQAFTIAGAEQD